MDALTLAKPQTNVGTVVAVRGSVVDAHFARRLPPINTVLRVCADDEILIEVLAQLDEHRVRGIALSATQGLARGMTIEDTRTPLRAPVGRNVLGRMFDVFGNVIDRRQEISGVELRSIDQLPPPLARRSTKSEVFETGIKIIDVLVPLERGGQGRVVRGRRGRKDSSPYRNDPQCGQTTRRGQYFLRYR